MYTASVNDADSDKRSEYDMKNESVVEKRHDMAWKVSWKSSYEIGISVTLRYTYNVWSQIYEKLLREACSDL